MAQALSLYDSDDREHQEALTHALLETVRVVLESQDSEDQETDRSASPEREVFHAAINSEQEVSEDSYEAETPRRRAHGPKLISSSSQPPGGPCAHCGATESPQWRRPLTKKVVLCNACGIYFSRHHTLPKRKKAVAQQSVAAATEAHELPPAQQQQQPLAIETPRLVAHPLLHLSQIPGVTMPFGAVTAAAAAAAAAGSLPAATLLMAAAAAARQQAQLITAAAQKALPLQALMQHQAAFLQQHQAARRASAAPPTAAQQRPAPALPSLHSTRPSNPTNANAPCAPIAIPAGGGVHSASNGRSHSPTSASDSESPVESSNGGAVAAALRDAKVQASAAVPVTSTPNKRRLSSGGSAANAVGARGPASEGSEAQRCSAASSGHGASGADRPAKRAEVLTPGGAAAAAPTTPTTTGTQASNMTTHPVPGAAEVTMPASTASQQAARLSVSSVPATATATSQAAPLAMAQYKMAAVAAAAACGSTATLQRAMSSPAGGAMAHHAVPFPGAPVLSMLRTAASHAEQSADSSDGIQQVPLLIPTYVCRGPRSSFTGGVHSPGALAKHHSVPTTPVLASPMARPPTMNSSAH